jgi:hypothetical protein
MKATKAEIAQRVEEILTFRLDGAQRHDIVRYAAEKGWDVKPRQIENYIRMADNLLIEQQEPKRKRLIGLHLARRGALYARAVNAGDYRTALAIADSEAKLQGLFPSDKEIRELARLAIQQDKRMRELEAKIDSAERDSATTPTDGQATGPTPTIGGDARPEAV